MQYIKLVIIVIIIKNYIVISLVSDSVNQGEIMSNLNDKFDSRALDRLFLNFWNCDNVITKIVKLLDINLFQTFVNENKVTNDKIH